MRYVGAACGIDTPVAYMDNNGDLEWYGRCRCGWESIAWSLTAESANHDTTKHMARGGR